MITISKKEYEMLIFAKNAFEDLTEKLKKVRSKDSPILPKVTIVPQNKDAELAKTYLEKIMAGILYGWAIGNIQLFIDKLIYVLTNQDFEGKEYIKKETILYANSMLKSNDNKLDKMLSILIKSLS